MKISSCVSLYLLLAAACVVQATYRYSSRWQCSCNGRSRYCLQDRWGLHCINCQGNTAGRHCERCKDGFYQQLAGPSCSPCGCDPVGSINSTCDGRGRCSCREGVTGEKCNRCSDGPIGPNGCTQRRQLREDSGSATLACFCYGHSSRCSAQSGYSIHPITSTFTDGPDGWKSTVQDAGPNDVLFRWSPRHQDLEVTSTNSLSVYLNAPGSYLGNQLLSYGQNLSFSLRIDHSAWQPSYDDVILEGAGLRVAASLGALQSAASCRQKKNYSLRLDEQPSSGWRPQLTTLQFQKLLQNLTAIKIRATFGQGRGYLDNVQLVTAQRGGGSSARWVWSCSCPLGYQGDFCDRCSAGFRRTNPAEGAFSSCQPCACRGGSCDPHTGDCYSADETPAERTCSPGFYRDPWYPDTCRECPCPDRVSCTLKDGSRQPQCDQCPLGTTGPRCDVCQEGFYGDPVGYSGVQRACRPCECNGHIRVGVPGSCDGSSGECLKCVDNTRGRSCESCLPGFYHSRASDACRSCDCDLRGSESTQCDSLGRCQCKPGFQGAKCQSSNCPACFTSIKMKMTEYATKLEQMVSDVDRGHSTADRSEMEAGLRSAQRLIDNMQLDLEKFTGLERTMQDELSSTNTNRMANRQQINNIAEVEDDVRQQHQLYNRKVEEIQNLLQEIQQKLDQAKNDLRSAEVPAGDASQGSGFSDLVQTAGRLADVHQREADVVQQTSGDALEKSVKSLGLVEGLMSNEKKVKEMIGDLKNTYDQTSAQVKGLENRAGRLSSEARDENILANNMVKDITDLERDIPSGLKDGVHGMASLLKDLTGDATRAREDFDVFQKGVEKNQAETENLLTEGLASGQKVKKLMDRIEVARDDTKDALQRITANADDLKDSLDVLKGFNQQINNYKTEADGAIQRLNGINSTVRQAVSKNGETESALRDISADYDQTLGTINTLEKLVNNIEGAFRSFPPQNDLLSESSKLEGDSENLKIQLGRKGRDLNTELDALRRLEKESGQAAAGAAGALNQARQSREAVGKALREINGLFAQLNQTGVVDQERLQQMEESLSSTQKNVDQRLKPRLMDVVSQEAAQRRRLVGINTDIDNILADIENLQQVLLAIPEGCYTTAPIENP